MCGILAAVSRKHTWNEDWIRQRLAILANRGPDGNGFWINQKRNLVLAHTRLSQVDFKNGQQPFTNEDGSIVLVMNGEFYGYEKWRSQLVDEGHVFRSKSDNEVVLHLYEKFGPAFIHHVHGEFALIIWDENKNRLIAARDRFGVKPLCYRYQNNDLVLGSTAESLADKDHPLRWNSEALYLSTQIQYTLPDQTLFSGISQLLPGHLLIFEGDLLTTEKYWAPESNSRKPYEQNGSFLDVLEGAVKRRLHGDAAICAQLSGGIDSAAVCALMSKIAGNNAHAFTIGFDDPSFSELESAEKIARHLGIHWHPIAVSENALCDHLDAAVKMSQGIAINAHLPAKHILHKKIHDAGFKAVLTGEGADEVLFGYPHFHLDWHEFSQTHNQNHEAVINNNPVALGIFLTDENIIPEPLRSCYIPAFLRAKFAMGRRLQTLFNKEFQKNDYQKKVFNILGSYFGDKPLLPQDAVSRSSSLWQNFCLAPYILKTLGDGTEMAHGVEGRTPFLDHELFEYCRSLPLNTFFSGGIEKMILRDSMKICLPNDVLTRPKNPFIAPPFFARINQTLRGYLLDSVRSELFIRQPLYDAVKVESLLERLPTLNWDEQKKWDAPLWMILSYHLLEKNLGVSW